ncbi:MAG: hypothetical protein ACRDPO_34855, partial [Streptosporangiaceae bacterium]
MTIWWLIRLNIALWILKATGKAIKWLAAAAVLIAAWPITLVAVTGFAGAWLRGWPPARLYRAARWSLPATAVYLLAAGVQAGSWQAAAWWPALGWTDGWRDLAAGHLATAFAVVAPVAVPAGLAIAGACWARRIWGIETGLDGRTATAPVVFDARQWKRQARTARGRLAVPATVPLLDHRGQIVMGATIRAIGHRWQPMLTISPAAMSRHQVIIGTSGAGKTNLMIRTWAEWHAAARRAWLQRGKPRPLLVVLDCKGGPDARAKAQRTRRLLHGTGATRVAIWPDDTGVSLWALPPHVLSVALFQMIDTGTGPAAYYADLTQATLSLAIHAPPGPPGSRLDFLDRLDAAWLQAAWAGHPRELAAITAARSHLGDIALRYRTLLERLGPGLDGPATLADADAWYFILEGTREQTVAEAQALAITELVAHAATSRDTEPRAILLACDDYSAISGRVPLWQLYERGRSLGVGVQVSAQSWQGLAPTDDERYRIAATADGGIWLMRTPYPEPLSQLAGTRRVVETATKMLAGMWGDEGSSRVQHAFTADPGIARTLATGQAGYIHAGGCTWTQIARPRPSPLPLPRSPARPSKIIPAEPAQAAQPRPGGN